MSIAQMQIMANSLIDQKRTIYLITAGIHTVMYEPFGNDAERKAHQ